MKIYHAVCQPDVGPEDAEAGRTWEVQHVQNWQAGAYLPPVAQLCTGADALRIADRHNARWGCLPSWVSADDLAQAGYSLLEGHLENGWHPGQTDDPNELAKKAFDDGAERVVFRKTENSQFYVVFECWVLWPEDNSDMENYERNE